MTNSFAISLARLLPKWIHSIELSKNEVSVEIYPEYVLPFFSFLQNHTHTQFKVLVDLTAVDYPSREKRFEVVYNLLSIQHNARIRIKTRVNELSARAAS